METPTTLISAFLLGLFSSVHCIGMCGGIIGALSLGLPSKIRNHKVRLFIFVTSFNAGRIISYMIAGAIAGTLGASVLTASGLVNGQSLLRYSGVIIMILIGAYLAGWLPKLVVIEKIGVPLWKKLEPVSQKLLPVDNIFKAVGYGLIWGWLPCGLVYFVLISAISSGGAINGTLTMYAFGMGTLPTLITAGMFTSRLARFARSPVARNITGVLIIAMAIATLFVPMGHHHH